LARKQPTVSGFGVRLKVILLVSCAVATPESASAMVATSSAPAIFRAALPDQVLIVRLSFNLFSLLCF
jgi:hypothetical protein